MIDTIKVPAIFLSFDDWWEREWVKYLPILANNNVKATFYPCIRKNLGMPILDSEEKIKDAIRPVFWPSLKEIQAQGHTIGFHSVNHLKLSFLIKSIGPQNLMKTEIHPGLKIFSENGFKPKHFAYPFGNYSPETNDALLKYFLTVRTIVPLEIPSMMRTYSVKDIQKTRVFIAYDLKYPGWQNALDSVFKKQGIGFFFTHNPYDSISELNELFYLAKKHGANFYPMSELEA
jgi:peptidoglycan/xylan/chitin deacetylase (PgdA/CDA1 family)